MLKFMKKNKKYIWKTVTLGLFGIAGILLAPVVMYMTKVSNRYPKVFGWIFFTAFILIGIYGFLFGKEWDISFSLICIGTIIAVNNIVNTNRR